MPYRGRFAPSPTGPLHMGSLVTALASYIDARANKGEWLVRIEDIDPPREKPGAAEHILSDLVIHGLKWDGEVIFQSNRLEAYESALSHLVKANAAFKCICPRRRLNSDGACASKCFSRQHYLNEKFAFRFDYDPRSNIKINDFILGEKIWNNQDLPKDFVIKRRDGLFSYQLAVLVDDVFQRITHVIRGSDLLDSTPKQLEIGSALNYPQLKYGHIPTITDIQGKKLSKQTFAPSINRNQAIQNLRQALLLLGQKQPDNILKTPSEILRSAIEFWDKNAIPKEMTLTNLPIKN